MNCNYLLISEPRAVCADVKPIRGGRVRQHCPEGAVVQLVEVVELIVDFPPAMEHRTVGRALVRIEQIPAAIHALEHKQPEKVLFYKLKDGTFLIDIPEKTDLEQTIDVEEMFR